MIGLCMRHIEPENRDEVHDVDFWLMASEVTPQIMRQVDIHIEDFLQSYRNI